MKLLFDYNETELFDINKNGIQLIDHGDTIEIYNDPFRTVPLFVTKNEANELIIFSEFKDYYDFDFVDRSVDEAGFWEIIIFGSGLWTRTLYKNVMQMPSATCLKINKKSEQYSISRYWHYDIKEDESIRSIEQAADGMFEILDDIFSKLDKKQLYFLGMSGGLDCRITLAFLSKHVPKHNIKLFTFGFDKNILEFEYAKNVANSLGVSAPEFHQLSAQSYKEALNYLPSLSGGQISINHCHILDYLRKYNFSDCRHISTYFSDAIFGFDCIFPKKLEEIQFNYYAKIMSNMKNIAPALKEDIFNDSLKIFAGYDVEANFSSLDEFKYVTERNQKFHMLLASLQNRCVVTDFIYADMTLLRYSLSMPMKYRVNKNVIDTLLDKYFKEISSSSLNNISSRDSKNSAFSFQWGNRFSGLLNWYLFRILNRVNSLLRVLTRGEIQILNKYQTEEHERLLYSDFKENLHAATAKFLAMGILSHVQKVEYDQLPIKSEGVAERYAIISLAKIL
jgi:hypothetical protein